MCLRVAIFLWFCRTLRCFTPRPPCPTNALSNEHFRSDRFCFCFCFLQPHQLGTERRAQRTLLFGPYFLRTLLFTGHGGGGVSSGMAGNGIP